MIQYPNTRISWNSEQKMWREGNRQKTQENIPEVKKEYPSAILTSAAFQAPLKQSN